MSKIAIGGNMAEKGYYRFPDIQDNIVAFVSEDDIWLVSKKGGIARRITTSLSRIQNPKISPNEKWIAFSAYEEGHFEIYLIPLNGGESKRITYLGSFSKVLGWDKEGNYIYFTSNFEQAYDYSIYKIHINKKVLERTLELWEKHSDDIIDCYIVANMELENETELYSFDKKISKLGIKSLFPVSLS